MVGSEEWGCVGGFRNVCVVGISEEWGCVGV